MSRRAKWCRFPGRSSLFRIHPIRFRGRCRMALTRSKSFQICRKDPGLTDVLFPLSTAKYTSHPVEKLELHLAIDSSSAIKNVYSPSHAVEIKRPDDKHAVVTYTSTNQVPTSDFRLLYD